MLEYSGTTHFLTFCCNGIKIMSIATLMNCRHPITKYWSPACHIDMIASEATQESYSNLSNWGSYEAAARKLCWPFWPSGSFISLIITPRMHKTRGKAVSSLLLVGYIYRIAQIFRGVIISWIVENNDIRGNIFVDRLSARVGKGSACNRKLDREMEGCQVPLR